MFNAQLQYCWTDLSDMYDVHAIKRTFNNLLQLEILVRYIGFKPPGDWRTYSN